MSRSPMLSNSSTTQDVRHSRSECITAIVDRKQRSIVLVLFSASLLLQMEHLRFCQHFKHVRQPITQISSPFQQDGRGVGVGTHKHFLLVLFHLTEENLFSPFFNTQISSCSHCNLAAGRLSGRRFNAIKPSLECDTACPTLCSPPIIFKSNSNQIEF